MARRKQIDPRVELADGDYMLRKSNGENVTISQVEREYKLRRGQLHYYRANYYSDSHAIRNKILRRRWMSERKKMSQKNA